MSDSQFRGAIFEALAGVVSCLETIIRNQEANMVTLADIKAAQDAQAAAAASLVALVAQQKQQIANLTVQLASATASQDSQADLQNLLTEVEAGTATITAAIPTTPAPTPAPVEPAPEPSVSNVTVAPAAT